MNKFLTLVLIFLFSKFITGQTQQIKLDPDKVQKFTPYMEWKHGGKTGFPVWKENNKLQYAQEMWYYTESFYVKRNHLAEGVTLNEEIIDISRFEDQRKVNDESIVILPGFKDAIVLIPSSQLIYKP
jgi:hypothetical protein